MRKIIAFIFTMVSVVAVSSYGEDLSSWLQRERLVAEGRILQNTSPLDGRTGSILASPSRHEPNYYYNWVRDSAIVMDVWMRQLEGQAPVMIRSSLEELMWDYVEFTTYGKGFRSETGPGEPRYNIDGTPNMEPWGRPQNDGPALRSSILIRFIRYLVTHGQVDAARARVWPVVVDDLNYVTSSVRSSSVDLWEEVRGMHFYTQVTMRAALLSGSDMANYFGDVAGGSWLRTQAAVLDSLIAEHYDMPHSRIVENLHREGGLRYKESGLDTATLLAVLHTQERPVIELRDPLLVGTMRKLEGQFESLYHINKRYGELGTAIGRYPEDRYYGGNPWFLTTLAYAEYYYLLGNLEEGDRYMNRVRFHTDANGSMSEQIYRDNGFMTSAYDLTWSYAAFLTAYGARQKLTSK